MVFTDDYEKLVLALCDVVRDIRKEQNLSQSELSRRSGLHRSYIGDLERGARNLSVKNMFRLAVALDVSASELVSLAEKKLNRDEISIRSAKERQARTV
jgi:transcriptional regulator with XRE-family HTH domain